MIRIQGACWGQGKCPICERPYQKELRFIWLWDDVEKKVVEDAAIILCSWCWIGLYAEFRNELGADVHVEWQNEKKNRSKRL